MLQTSDISKKDWNQRHLEAVMKRETDDNFFRMKSHIDQMKWSLYRKKKADLLEKRDKQLDRNQKAQIWIRLILLHLAVVRWNDNCRGRISEKIKHMQSIFLVD